jgi:hypothetical protein
MNVLWLPDTVGQGWQIGLHLATNVAKTGRKPKKPFVNGNNCGWQTVRK